MRIFLRGLVFFALLRLASNVFAYSIIIDASDIPADMLPECVDFISDTANKSYAIILPPAAEPWQKKIVRALDELAAFESVGSLYPVIWLAGVGTLGTSDADDIIVKSVIEYSVTGRENVSGLFVDAQMPDTETFQKMARAGIKKIYTLGTPGMYRDSVSGIYVISCKPFWKGETPDVPDENIPIYAKADSFDDLREIFNARSPEFPDLSGVFPPPPTDAGIILSGINLKLWDFFAQSRSTLEKYKNSGASRGEKLIPALESVYKLENISNWKDENNAANVLYGIADVYEAIGAPLPAAYADISNILFEELKELPVSVSESGMEYLVNAKDGYFTIGGSFNIPADVCEPLEFYWWNPSAGYSVKKDIDGGDLAKPVNFCLYLTDKCYFYASSDDGWQRLWNVFSVERSSASFLVKIPLTYLQLSEKTNISFFIKTAGIKTRPLSVSLPDSAVSKKWIDAVGDAKGPGWYELPDGAPAGIADIMSLSIFKSAKRTVFSFSFAGPLSFENFHAGFDLYADINGRKRKGQGTCRNGLNCYLEDASYWEYMLSVSSASAVFFEGDKKLPCVLKIDSSGRIATVSVESEIFPYDPAKCRFTFCVYMIDDKGDILEVMEEADDTHPGGGKPSQKSPNVLDIITTSAIRQKQILGAYMKKRGVSIPPLP